MTLEQLRARQREIEARLRAIDEEAGDAALSDEQRTEFDALLEERSSNATRIAGEERRAAERAALGRAVSGGDTTTERGSQGPAVITSTDPGDVLADRSRTGRERRQQLIDATLRAAESTVEDGGHQRNFERLLRRHSRQQWWLENLLSRSTERYTEAFELIMQGRAELLTGEQRAAIAIGTTTQGGYLVPTFLDPTLMITSDGSANVMRQYASVSTLVSGSTWNGVTTAGVTASWDAELAEVSDDSPSVGAASIAVYKPQALVQASIEAFEDVSGLATDVLTLFADARDVLEGAAHMTGTGSAPVPLGLFTAINASSTLQITSTTAATIGEVDLAAVKLALPQRFRRMATQGRQGAMWVMNPTYAEAIKRLGTYVSATFSGDLTQPTSDRIKGYGVVETDDAPSTQTTTALDQEIVFADLKQYKIIDKPGGTSVEFVPLMMGSNGRPNGTRAWYMHWRTGAGMPVLQAGRILVDKTSA